MFFFTSTTSKKSVPNTEELAVISEIGILMDALKILFGLYPPKLKNYLEYCLGYILVKIQKNFFFQIYCLLHNC